MAYAFRIHEPKKPTDPAPISAATMDGWSQTAHISGNLLSNIPLGLGNNKMGTSIPSFFARIFLFNGAFQTLNGANFAKLTTVNSDTILVSECLDMLEFVFQHGGDSKLVIKHWNAQQQINNLRADGHSEHAKLAEVLEDEIRNYPLLSDIFLFFWKDSTPKCTQPQEFLIGGTSPYTLAFTSPNWGRIARENGFNFNRLNGRPMFTTDSIEPLSARDDTFKSMVYSLYMSHNATMGNQATDFNSYVATMWNAETFKDPNILTMGGNPALFNEAFQNAITDIEGNQVVCGSLPLRYPKMTIQASGYEINTPITRYQQYVARDGSNQTISAPLVLNDNGLTGVTYIGRSVWNPQTCKINEAEVRTTEMHERLAPGGMGIQHPFLIWSDFLEDKIIKLSYPINSTSFLTAFNGESNYLLPLKRNFFRYFDIDDITRVACNGTNKKLVEVTINGNRVTVTINVPIKDATHKTIELKKEYSGEDIISADSVLLGFYPFYKCDDDTLNRYSVVNVGDANRLDFFKVSSLDRAIDKTSKTRTNGTRFVSKTEYYLLKNSFDIVELFVGENKGIILPLMQEVQDRDDNHYSFAVDFGTSNTYISHVTTNQPNAETLEIDAHDQQTVFLGSTIGTSLRAMDDYLSREFAPLGLGEDYKVSYPIRTAVCEVSNFETVQPDLFGNISIGFNMMHEPVAIREQKYRTGLKWLLEEKPGDAHHTNRVKYYFLQTLWMLKNESFMNGGGQNFDVYITYPQAMKNPDALFSLWRWAKDELGIQCKLKHDSGCSESVAPYNCMANQIGGSSYLNVDIGGGTSDLLFVNKDGGGTITSAHYASSMFAGDDLWGDGKRISTVGNDGNGFVQYVTQAINAASATYPNEILRPLNALESISNSSADVMSYLFKHDKVFQTSEKIKSQRNLYSLVFIHYAALIYNVARIIKKLDMEIPAKLSFTGMGSKYINMISSNTNVVKELTKYLLEQYTGKQASKAFEIVQARGVGVKEITAKGVLAGLNIDDQFKLPADSLVSICDYGFDTEQTLTYADIRKDNVRKAAIDNFGVFVDSLSSKDFTNLLFSKFNLTISKELLNDLKNSAEESFRIFANVPEQFNDINVQESLFFWCLKNSLVKISKKYAQYK
ncbi:MAG: hypothetical protein IJE12_05800 [Prevotella sp.]|nr:hypothetical protein [Prevotella sp.]